MTTLDEIITKCRGRKSIRLCFQNRATTLDTIQILPGLDAKVIVHGHPKGDGRKYLPTIATLSCRQLFDYVNRKTFGQDKT